MPEVETGTAQRAEEIALKRYGRDFNELPPQEQMRVWLEAEHRDVTDCPHYKGHTDGVGGCRRNEGRACEFELGRPCEEWLNTLREWHEEKTV